VHDHRAALRGAQHIVAVHRVALLPLTAVRRGGDRFEAACQRPHLPAGITKLPRHLAADAAGRAENQDRLAAAAVHHLLLRSEDPWLIDGASVSPAALQWNCRACTRHYTFLYDPG